MNEFKNNGHFQEAQYTCCLQTQIMKQEKKIKPVTLTKFGDSMYKEQPVNMTEEEQLKNLTQDKQISQKSNSNRRS